MSFIAGYIAGLEDGEEYSHEDKVIRENGVYTPDDGVRWDKVTVDVSGLYADIFDSMPTFWTSEMFGDGWRVLLKFDSSGSLKKDNWYYDRDYIIEDGVKKTVFYQKTWVPQLYLAVYYKGQFIYSVNSTDNLGGYNRRRRDISSDHTSMTYLYTFEDIFSLLGIEDPLLTFASPANTVLSFTCKADVNYRRTYRYSDTGEISSESESTNSRDINIALYINGQYSLTDLSDDEFKQKLGDFIDSVKLKYNYD